MIIEEAVCILFDYFNNSFNPKILTISSFVNDAKHSTVEVTKSNI